MKDLNESITMKQNIDNFVTIPINDCVMENRITKPHLIAARIVANKDRCMLITIAHEGWDLVTIGVEDLVKEVCDYAQIDYNKIVFGSSNLNPKLNYFEHEIFPYNFNILNMHCKEIECPDVINYGLFLGRPTNERLCAFYQHLNWRYKNRGIATFHFDPTSFGNLNDTEFVDYLITQNKQWNFLKKYLPYSDLNNRLYYPIVDESHSDVDFWKKTYEKISIEVVCETAIHRESFFITEKTLRPILYKRLFVIVGSKDYEKRLKKIGIDTFDDIIDKSYDRIEYNNRVKFLFDSLEIFLENTTTECLQKLNNRLENNKQVVENLMLNERKRYQKNKNYLEKNYPIIGNDWIEKNYPATQ